MMKKLAVQAQAECMACLACTNACEEAFYKSRDKGLACLKVIEKNGKVTPKVCTQCGLCAKACESDAITQNPKGVYMINKTKCTNCGKCIEACPIGVVAKAEDREVPSKCIACGICVKSCPMDVLYIKED